jgi:dihydrofolate reductase
MIRLIAAVDEKYGIAKNGVIPWHLPGELQYFAELTKRHGGVVLMGQKTYEAIGHPLSDRQNFILGHNKKNMPGVTYVDNLEVFLAEHPDVWVIGGQSVFEQTLSLADELYLTHMHADFACNQFFPLFSEQDFSRVSESAPAIENDTSYTFVVYKRV